MKCHIKYNSLSESGQSLVEFALLLPVLLIILGLTCEVGRIVDTKILLNSATCEIVRGIDKTSNINQVIRETLNINYSDRLNISDIKIKTNVTSEKKKYHTYHARDSYGRYIQKTSYYTYKEVTIKLEYKMDFLCPLSNLIFQEDYINLNSDYTGRVPTGGFEW